MIRKDENKVTWQAVVTDRQKIVISVKEIFSRQEVTLDFVLITAQLLLGCVKAVNVKDS